MRKIIYLLLLSLPATASINESDFHNIPDRVLEAMSAEIESSGLTIEIDKDWDTEIKNAGANRRDNTGTIKIYGGYARIKEMTNESFAQTLCHELGHLIADGIKVMPTLKYASESEADYFSTKICLRKYFTKYPSYREATQWQIKKCAQNRVDNEHQCRQLLIASRDSLEVKMHQVPGTEDYTTLDETKSPITIYNDYAGTRCRYTSYVYGALGLNRPLCWFNENSPLTKQKYITDYQYDEAQFVGSLKNITKTFYGCSFELTNISHYRESYLSPLSMRKVSGKKIYLYGKCELKEGKVLSGIITQYNKKLYYNLESKDK